ncbi:hypothetical protein BOTBODRAFT_181917 [Botryobasidium botryosum FD-172 SS1]|uniref:Uncharacterized protein n=1 Tax=Botryobasidium botryosum (strain FD-172 SS1) TaxID=930990 RepID=A0A067LSR7_BOTB1|nr:hypothetical protein BOTBODRAFT_181917 [Botryobasidium botryosum FD-172 SS1]
MNSQNELFSLTFELIIVLSLLPSRPTPSRLRSTFAPSLSLSSFSPISNVLRGKGQGDHKATGKCYGLCIPRLAEAMRRHRPSHTYVPPNPYAPIATALDTLKRPNTSFHGKSTTPARSRRQQRRYDSSSDTDAPYDGNDACTPAPFVPSLYSRRPSRPSIAFLASSLAQPRLVAGLAFPPSSSPSRPHPSSRIPPHQISISPTIPTPNADICESLGSSRVISSHPVATAPIHPLPEQSVQTEGPRSWLAPAPKTPIHAACASSGNREPPHQQREPPTAARTAPQTHMRAKRVFSAQSNGKDDSSSRAPACLFPLRDGSDTRPPSLYPIALPSPRCPYCIPVASVSPLAFITSSSPFSALAYLLPTNDGSNVRPLLPLAPSSRLHHPPPIIVGPTSGFCPCHRSHAPIFHFASSSPPSRPPCLCCLTSTNPTPNAMTTVDVARIPGLATFAMGTQQPIQIVCDAKGHGFGSYTFETPTRDARQSPPQLREPLTTARTISQNDMHAFSAHSTHRNSSSSRAPDALAPRDGNDACPLIASPSLLFSLSHPPRSLVVIVFSPPFSPPHCPCRSPIVPIAHNGVPYPRHSRRVLIALLAALSLPWRPQLGHSPSRVSLPSPPSFFSIISKPIGVIFPSPSSVLAAYFLKYPYLQM